MSRSRRDGWGREGKRETGKYIERGKAEGSGKGKINDVCDGAAKEDVIIIIEIIIALVIISDKNDNNAEGDLGPATPISRGRTGAREIECTQCYRKLHTVEHEHA